jgi:hypothetical protein
MRTFLINTCAYVGLASPDSYLSLDRSSEKRHKKKKRRKGKKGNFTDQHTSNCQVFLFVLIVETDYFFPHPSSSKGLVEANK